MVNIAMVDPQVYINLCEFLYNEAEILDNEMYREWLEMLGEDFEYLITYVQPEKGAKLKYSEDSFLMKANKQKLSEMVKRLYHPSGWALQDSLSRFRRIVGNIRVKEASNNTVRVRSNIALFRIEMNEGSQSVITGEREDLLSLNGEIRLRKRVVVLDSPSLLTYNLYFPI
ncbi:small subunit of phenylpropionate dioxygenase [Sulfolobus acidocaldarius SUSAZ]|nr:small subunit of phenylpropionate dioxygenase [Sulfolobus acidocaldarius SUSAZ]